MNYYALTLLFFAFFGTIHGKTVTLKEANPTIATRLFGHQEQQDSELKGRTNYVWPIFVSPLSLATKDEFFTLVKKTESTDNPGHFILNPVFEVSDAILSNKKEVENYFSQLIPEANPETLKVALNGLKRIEIEGSTSNHYIVPIIKLDDLRKLTNHTIILFKIPESEAELTLAQEKLEYEQTTMSDPLYELVNELSGYSDFLNFVRVEEVKDYIRKFEKIGNPWAGEFYSITE